MSLVVQVRPPDPRAVVVVARGECDVVGSERLRAALDRQVAAGHVRIVADLTRVTFVDSTGLGVLVGMRRHLDGRNGHLGLVVDHGTVDRLLRISALAQQFTIHHTVEHALAACAAQVPS